MFITNDAVLRYGALGTFSIYDYTCHYFCRAHKNWDNFLDEVDNIVPLTEIKKVSVDEMTQQDDKIKVRFVDQQSWIQGHTNDEIKSAQRNDTALQIIIKWLEYQKKPDKELF